MFVQVVFGCSRPCLRRDGRVAEGARLESVYRLIPYRGFESPSLRHFLFELGLRQDSNDGQGALDPNISYSNLACAKIRMTARGPWTRPFPIRTWPNISYSNLACAKIRMTARGPWTRPFPIRTWPNISYSNLACAKIRMTARGPWTRASAQN